MDKAGARQKQQAGIEAFGQERQAVPPGVLPQGGVRVGVTGVLEVERGRAVVHGVGQLDAVAEQEHAGVGEDHVVLLLRVEHERETARVGGVVGPARRDRR